MLRMANPPDEALRFLQARDPVAGRNTDAIFAILWTAAPFVVLLLALYLQDFTILNIPLRPAFFALLFASVGLWVAGPFVVALRYAIRAAPDVRRTCARSWREQLHLAGLSPHACLSARLHARSERLFGSILLTSAPYWMTALLASMSVVVRLAEGAVKSGSGGALAATYAWRDGIRDIAGETLLVLASVASLWFASAVARSAVDEMAIRARDSDAEGGIGLGDLVVHGVLAVFSRLAIGAPGIAGLGVAHLAFMNAYPRPSVAMSSIWAALGGIVLWMLARRMADRRELARVRMDAPE